MNKRPLFNKSIGELENLFETDFLDESIVAQLLHELEFRSTKRAAALSAKISASNKASTISGTGNRNEIEHRPVDQIDVPAQKQPSDMSDEPISPSFLSEYSPGPKPPITNKTDDILRAWTALEVLSPQGYRREIDLVAGDKSRIAQLNEGALPWERGERSRPKKRLYYELILGTINLGPAVESLLKVYGDKRPDPPSVSRRSPIASILLDKEGRPLEEDTSFAISSFAWGVPIALNGDLKELASWPSAEQVLTKSLREKLIKRDREGDVLPLTTSSIDALYSFLVRALNLQGQEISPPHFAIRRYEFFASKVPPEPSLLNSFFLEDLATARNLADKSELPKALKFYLGASKPKTKTDLLEDSPATGGD
jgi:hypothetical protein